MSMFNNWNGPDCGGLRTLPGEDVLMQLQNWLFDIKTALNNHIHEAATSPADPHDVQALLTSGAAGDIKVKLDALANNVADLTNTGNSAFITGSIAATAVTKADSAVAGHNSRLDAHNNIAGTVSRIGAELKDLQDLIELAFQIPSDPKGNLTSNLVTVFSKAITAVERITAEKGINLTGDIALTTGLTKIGDKDHRVDDLYANQVDTLYMLVRHFFAMAHAIVGAEGIDFDNWTDLHLQLQGRTVVSNPSSGNPEHVLILGALHKTNTLKDKNGELIYPTVPGGGAVPHVQSIAPPDARKRQISATVYIKYINTNSWEATVNAVGSAEEYGKRGSLSVVYSNKNEVLPYARPNPGDPNPVTKPRPKYHFGLYSSTTGTGDSEIFLGVSFPDALKSTDEIQLLVNSINLDTSVRPNGAVAELCVVHGDRRHGVALPDTTISDVLTVETVQDEADHDYIVVTETDGKSPGTIRFGHEAHDLVLRGEHSRPYYEWYEDGELHPKEQIAYVSDIVKSVITEGEVFFFSYSELNLPGFPGGHSPNALWTDIPIGSHASDRMRPDQIPNSGNQTYNGIALIIPRKGEKIPFPFTDPITPPYTDYGRLYKFLVDPTSYKITWLEDPTTPGQGPKPYQYVPASLAAPVTPPAFPAPPLAVDWIDEFDPEKLYGFQYHAYYHIDAPWTNDGSGGTGTGTDTFWHQSDLLWTPFASDPVDGVRVNAVNLVLEGYFNQIQATERYRDIRDLAASPPDFFEERQLIPSPLPEDNNALVPNPTFIHNKAYEPAPRVLDGGNWDVTTFDQSLPNIRILNGGDWDSPLPNINLIKEFYRSALQKIWHGSVANMAANADTHPQMTRYALKYTDDEPVEDTNPLGAATNISEGKRLLVSDIDPNDTTLAKNMVVGDPLALGGAKFEWDANNPVKGIFTFPRIDRNYPDRQVEMTLPPMTDAWLKQLAHDQGIDDPANTKRYTLSYAIDAPTGQPVIEWQEQV